MENTFLTTYTVLAVMLTVVDFNYCYQAYRKTEPAARYLCLSALFAGVITFSYLISIRTRNPFYMSVSSSVYFACIDWMLVSLVHFVYQFTKTDLAAGARVIRPIIRGYAAFDTLVMVINVFRPIAVEYVASGDPMTPYVYRMHPLYILHLIFTYSLVIITLYILMRKAFTTPRQYRSQYFLVALAILVVVAVNAVYLFLDTDSPLTKLDWSVFGYSVGLYLLFWAAFSYRQNNMLKSLSMMIFENIDQGIVLFDHMGELIMHNRRMEQLLPDIPFRPDTPEEEFRAMCAIQDMELSGDRYSVQCEKKGAHGQPLRCDYSRLKDDEGGTVGNLFVFSDETNNSDLLTGFIRVGTFQRYAAENPYLFGAPTAVAVFDIVGLREINQTFGREVGDQRIRNLAKTMRHHLPKEAYFVRGHEAHLVAVCQNMRETDILEMAAQVAAASAGTVIYGLSEIRDDREETETVAAAIGTAARTLQTKKLLYSKSHHSQTLSSLVRALQESDSDTEAHVLRTQKMGEALGRRIGLCDEQLTDLRLLCLLHDIGKIGIPLEILNKPGRLTEAEWAVLQTHAEKGYQIAMSSEELKSIAPMILYHHERWDGHGYPERLSGETIPLLSRVISVVDSYDAMVNNRSYRKGMTPEEAQAEIRRCSGTQFDPGLTEEFLKMLEENPDIAAGEKTGGEEVRVFNPEPVQAGLQGNTVMIPFSRYLLDLDDIIIEVDDSFETITGYSRADAVGRMTQTDLIPPENRAYYLLQVNNSFSRRNIAYLKHELLRKDGEILWVVCHGKRYYDSAEKAFRSEIYIFKSVPGQL